MVNKCPYIPSYIICSDIPFSPIVDLYLKLYHFHAPLTTIKLFRGKIVQSLLNIVEFSLNLF